MPAEPVGGVGLAVVAGDVLALRGAGLAAAETWALLCQAAQALQDLFLSNGGVVGGSRMGPVVTPHTLELTARGRVTLQLAPLETARAYLPPEYRPGRIYSDTDSEKMWMYSLGRALLDTTPRVAALTGTVSVSPPSALQSVLAAMTEPDPRRRASLMNLLDVISEYCRTRLQSKPFTHIVMDMYREVVRSPQFAARKRLVFQQTRLTVPPQIAHHQHPQMQPHQPHHQHHHQPHQHHQQDHQPQNQQLQNYQTHQAQNHQSHQTQSQHQQSSHFSKHQAKGALFKAQSRNSRSHPNLLSLSGYDIPLGEVARPEFQSQLNIQASYGVPAVRHARTNSQPEYSDRGRLPQTTSSQDFLEAESNRNSQLYSGNIYSDPIYALPVKPFLSSQDVRVNGFSAKPLPRNDIYATANGVYATPRGPDTRSAINSQPNIAHSAQVMNGLVHSKEDVYSRIPKCDPGLDRQYSNPQLPYRSQESNFRHSSQPNVASGQLQVYPGPTGQQQAQSKQQNPLSSINPRSLPAGTVPPKPPRIITTLKKTTPRPDLADPSVPPAKPPRIGLKNGPRARRGKAVQRAPSRLYRAIGGSSRCFNKTQCVGPEFVIRANQPPKVLNVGDVKNANVGRIIVIMLTGQRLEVTCDSQRITAGELFQAIVQTEELDENFTLGLAALLAGDFAILPPDTKLNKVAPPGWLNSVKSKGLLGLPTSFMLYLRLRFFLPSLRGIRSWISKHLLYLQIRRCILEQQLVCSLAQLINLTGLALQAEFGNYSVNEHGRGDYFLLEHYIPESLILVDQTQLQLPGEAEALKMRLHQAHRDRRGLDANKAEEMFIVHAQALPDYGSHYYIATIDTKELGKIVSQQRKNQENLETDRLYAEPNNIYELERSSEYPVYGRIEFPKFGSRENLQPVPFGDEQKMKSPKSGSLNDGVYSKPKSPLRVSRTEPNNNNRGSNNRTCKSKKTESNVWLAIHAQGLKLLDRGGRPRERVELARFQWRDIQTLSYNKSCLVIYSRLNGKRCKFKLRMDHRKSYFAFKLTSLHHQFFLKLRSELTSLQGLATDFGVPLIVEPNSPPPKLKPDNGKTKISIANSVKKQRNLKCTMQLEEFQNKENENPQKDSNQLPNCNSTPVHEPVCYTPEDDALYAQVNARLEPEGESRDTEDEFDRGMIARADLAVEQQEPEKVFEGDELYSRPKLDFREKESAYSVPKPSSLSEDCLSVKTEKPEELYAAINKSGLPKKNDFPVPEEVWDVMDAKKALHKVKTSSLPNYGSPRQSSGFRTPSLPRRLGVKMGTRAIYSSLVQRDLALADDLESMSLKSDTASSLRSASARSTESPMPEAYVLNTDIRTNDETFRVPDDETMSSSLAARLEELSFAEERILHTIKLERGHGGSIGLQVTEGNDGGVYVQAVSVGGSADMAGNVNKGDRIVAINGQSLLNFRYEEALKMLQNSPEMVELVLSQITNRKYDLRQNEKLASVDRNYMQDIRFDVSSEAETSSMTTKWLAQKTADVASVQNTSSAYSSAASSAMDNHNANSLYTTEVVDTNGFNSASMLLSIEDFDLSRTSRQVFI
ncbi:uncharacterized protein LOC105697695 [Orussus abietinus]|uniref:uncharacterized protein LOC105697695 n=1 Tax=Orussus abietinus TaxID=222816 RepID=UPI0006250909|nr:uncharacterized protein LOC105697695 [Orussus abietinus]